MTAASRVRLKNHSPHGLREVSDSDPGIRRIPRGRAFAYLEPGGKPVRNPAVVNRIKSLVIPPAWKGVWICPAADGHIQATGRDARGRKQYCYHPDWEPWREERKTNRLLELATALPRIRRRVRRDLRSTGLPREKVLALMVRLLEVTSIRAGHPEYAAQNRSYGLASMKDGHAISKGRNLEFRFRGKGGKPHEIAVDDPLLCRLVEHCRRLPGSALFQYQDGGGEPRAIRAADLNDYLKAVSGREVTAKDLRTWTATVLAFRCLRKNEAFQSAAEAKRNIMDAIRAVAGQLGNTPAICRKSYIHARVFHAYTNKSLTVRNAPQSAGLRDDEAAVLALLNRRTRNDC